MSLVLTYYLKSVYPKGIYRLAIARVRPKISRGIAGVDCTEDGCREGGCAPKRREAKALAVNHVAALAIVASAARAHTYALSHPKEPCLRRLGEELGDELSECAVCLIV